MADALFAHIEQLHGTRPWGDVLDAGTGEHSLRWLSSLPTTSLTAVTADPSMADAVAGILTKPHDVLVQGTWNQETLLAQKQYDVIVADYLLGAIDGFTPYVQDLLFPRLVRHLRGRLYVVGLEPWPDRGTTRAEQAWVELCRLRDAAFLVSGARPYREYPESWVVRQLTAAGLRIVDQRTFTIVQSRKTVDREWGNATRTLAHIAGSPVERGLRQRADELRAELYLAVDRGLRFGRDWVIAAERL